MRIRLNSTTLSLMLALFTNNANADDITLRADEWCPYNCDPKSEDPGFMIDIAKAVFEEQGHKLNYELMNWARAIEDVKNGAAVGLVGAGANDAPELIFPTVPQGMQQMCFFTKPDSTWKYENVASLKTIKLASVKDYSYDSEVDKYIEENPAGVVVLSGEGTIEKAVKMVLADRVDAYVDDQLVLDIHLRESNQQNALRTAGCSVSEAVFIAFSPANPKGKEYANLLSTGTQKLRESGKLAEILKKYSVKDWK